jgi:hypothetical protein
MSRHTANDETNRQRNANPTNNNNKTFRERISTTNDVAQTTTTLIRACRPTTAPSYRCVCEKEKHMRQMPFDETHPHDESLFVLCWSMVARQNYRGGLAVVVVGNADIDDDDDDDVGATQRLWCSSLSVKITKAIKNPKELTWRNLGSRSFYSAEYYVFDIRNRRTFMFTDRFVPVGFEPIQQLRRFNINQKHNSSREMYLGRCEQDFVAKAVALRRERDQLPLHAARRHVPAIRRRSGDWFVSTFRSTVFQIDEH